MTAAAPEEGPEPRPLPSGIRLLQGYYLSTPAFWLVDTLWGAPLRAAALSGYGARTGYYVVVFGLGIVTYVRPGLAPLVGIGESSANLLLLILAVMLPIWGALDAFAAGAPTPEVLGPASLANVMLSGSVLILSFHRSRAGLRGWRGR